MKKCIYQTVTGCILFLTFGQLAMAQPAPPPGPPKAPVAVIESDDKQEQKEVIIRQKGDKDTKIVLEIKNGEYFINGKPLEKFDDQNIVVERRDMLIMDDGPGRSYRFSPYRNNEWEEAGRAQELANLDMQRSKQEMHRSMERVMNMKMSSAFLGVSSRKSDKGGATVLEITKGSAAEKAGLKKGDIITKVNDTKIENPDMLFETIKGFKPGDKIKVGFTRDGKDQTVTATLEKSELAPKAYNFKYNYDYNMPPLGDMGDLHIEGWNFGRPKMGIKAQDAEDGKGVNVLEVSDSSAAWKAGLKKGDIILQIDGKDVNNVNELVEQTMDMDRQKYTYKLKILRNGTPQEIEVKIPRKLKTAEL